MPTMENIKLDSLYCLFKGEPGTRKSTQALSFPKPQYWFSFDEKMEALKLPMKLWGINPKDITYDDYNDWNKAEEKLKRFQVECPFKTIVVDTVTSMGDATNSQTLKIKSGTTTQAGAEAGKRIAGIPVNTMEDFNAETAVFQSLLKLTKDISKFHKVNIILIAHVIQTDYKSPNGVTHVSRSIVTGVKKIAAKIPGRCHEVYHFNMKGDFTDKLYSVLTTHSGDDFARTILPLEKEIVFGDLPLYDKYIIPAMKKLDTMETALPQSF